MDPAFAAPRRRRAPLLAWIFIPAVLALSILGLILRQGPSDEALPEAEPATPIAARQIGDLPATPAALLRYTVAPGDSLGGIATRFGISVESLMRLNGLANPDSILIGQELQLRIEPERDAPDGLRIPDSELVHGPAYLDFDSRAYLSRQAGRLGAWQELVDGEPMTGAEALDRIARELSVGPRVLLAFVEARSGQVTGEGGPELADYPAGLVDPSRSGAWLQLSWLADRLNGGYYDLKTRGNGVVTTRDGVHLAAPEGMNPGSFAVLRALALQSTEAELPGRMADFEAAYRRLFGDPWASALPPIDPAEIDFPALRLPWASGSTWWMTGGPHGGWADGSAWAALDFVPPGEERGCFVSEAWATAVADGLVLDGAEGELWLDLDEDGDRRTGPAIQYLHLSSQERVAAGTRVKAGDPLGHPSCEGGFSTATHLHLSRSYDGEWLPAAGLTPMQLGGWRAWGTGLPYDGGLEHEDGRRREACECRLEDLNAIAR